MEFCLSAVIYELQLFQASWPSDGPRTEGGEREVRRAGQREKEGGIERNIDREGEKE